MDRKLGAGLGILVFAGGALFALMNIGPQVNQAAMGSIDLALRDAARAEEVFYAVQDPTDPTGLVGYTADVNLLIAEQGLVIPPEISITIPRADFDTYCIEARFNDADGIWHLTKENPTRTEGAC